MTTPDMRRITLVTDRLSAGGVERRLVLLADGLKRRGCDVSVLVYRPDDFFAGALAEAGAPVTRLRARSRPGLAFAIRKAILRNRSDAAISFQNLPNALVELAGAPRRNFAVVASESVLDISGRNLRQRARYALHLLADAVVSNSHAQRERIAELAPWLEGRVHVIVNGVDLERFSPRPDGGRAPDRAERLRLLVPARIHEQKNPLGLLEAVDIVRRERPSLDLTVDWYGDSLAAESRRVSGWEFRNRRRTSEYQARLKRAIAERGLQDSFRLHPSVRDVAPLYRAADAVCLPSFTEGTANVVCEAMACGVPLLASRVGDTPRLVRDGRNGFLFDPESPRDMVRATIRFADLSPEARRGMGLEGRRAAESTLSMSAFVDRYVELVERIAQRRRP